VKTITSVRESGLTAWLVRKRAILILGETSHAHLFGCREDICNADIACALGSEKETNVLRTLKKRPGKRNIHQNNNENPKVLNSMKIALNSPIRSNLPKKTIK